MKATRCMRFPCGKVAGVGLPTHRVRCSHGNRDAHCGRGARHIERDREFADDGTKREHHRELAFRVVIVAGELDARLSRKCGKLLKEVQSISLRSGTFNPVHHEAMRGFNRNGFLPCDLGDVAFDLAILPLAGRMVHQGDEIDQPASEEV